MCQGYEGSDDEHGVEDVRLEGEERQSHVGEDEVLCQEFENLKQLEEEPHTDMFRLGLHLRTLACVSTRVYVGERLFPWVLLRMCVFVCVCAFNLFSSFLGLGGEVVVGVVSLGDPTEEHRHHPWSNTHTYKHTHKVKRTDEAVKYSQRQIWTVCKYCMYISLCVYRHLCVCQ